MKTEPDLRQHAILTSEQINGAGKGGPGIGILIRLEMGSGVALNLCDALKPKERKSHRLSDSQCPGQTARWRALYKSRLNLQQGKDRSG